MGESEIVVGQSAHGTGWRWFETKDKAEASGATQIQPATPEEAACAVRLMEADRLKMPMRLLGKLMRDQLAKRGDPAPPPVEGGAP